MCYIYICAARYEAWNIPRQMGSGQCGSRPVYCTAETHFFTINDSFITAEKILKEEKTREENTILTTIIHVALGHSLISLVYDL